jgi:hypothetical protein
MFLAVFTLIGWVMRRFAPRSLRETVRLSSSSWSLRTVAVVTSARGVSLPTAGRMMFSTYDAAFRQ